MTETIEIPASDLRVGDFVWQTPASASFRIEPIPLPAWATSPRPIEHGISTVHVRYADGFGVSHRYFTADQIVRVVR